MSKIKAAEQLMRAFVSRTGLEPASSTPRRYLWTDAFAVCNLLTLHHHERDGNEYIGLARKLVDQVHHTLGRHRPDDALEGWLSGLSEEEGAAHPTKGGLRIGKSLPERQPDESPDQDLEWDQDGQYFHYLTKWMHALAAMYRETREVRHLTWAIELAKAVHPRFTHSGGTRMYWKMSVDLSRPLVSSMGQHDALDALVTYSALRVAAHEAALTPDLDLNAEIADAARMCSRGVAPTDDSLGIGGLLLDASRLAQLVACGDAEAEPILLAVMSAADTSLASYDADELKYPARARLAFRELGIAIGLRAVKLVGEQVDGNGQTRFKKREHMLREVEKLRQHEALADRIEEFWMEEDNRNAKSWMGHEDINAVMLATTLSPDAFLEI